MTTDPPFCFGAESAPESTSPKSVSQRTDAEHFPPSIISIPRPALLAGLYAHARRRSKDFRLPAQERHHHATIMIHIRARAHADPRVAWTFELLVGPQQRRQGPLYLRKKQ